MTNNEIRIAVAELCGVVECDEWHTFIAGASMMKNGTCNHTNCVPRGVLPNYPESLDACAEFERTLKNTKPWMSSSEGNEPVNYYGELMSLVGVKCRNFEGLSYLAAEQEFKVLLATPLQRCIAFLKLHGKYKE